MSQYRYLDRIREKTPIPMVSYEKSITKYQLNLQCSRQIPVVALRIGTRKYCYPSIVFDRQQDLKSIRQMIFFICNCIYSNISEQLFKKLNATTVIANIWVWIGNFNRSFLVKSYYYLCIMTLIKEQMVDIIYYIPKALNQENLFHLAYSIKHLLA